ncbi:thioesterase family protein [Porticoccaceae bacterium]|jgi:acyl-CoA thioesterase FadM|nr:thioesterase family protein [Porticoccaceae bacterium]
MAVTCLVIVPTQTNLTPMVSGFMAFTTTFPFAAQPAVVTDEMCDQNGHMNVQFYSKVFGEALIQFYVNDMGFSKSYFNSGFSTFTLEQNIKYVQECLVNEPLAVHYRLHNINKKLIHLASVLLNRQGQLCAIYETVLGHVDMGTRKTAEMDGDFFNNLRAIQQQHTVSIIDVPLRLGITSL